MIRLYPKTKAARIRLGVLIAIVLILFVFKFVFAFLGFVSYEPRIGDILFQPLPKNELVNAIEGATHSPYSHCGVVMKKNGRWVVIEAFGTVKYTSLYLWVTQGRYGQFAVYRLKPAYAQVIPKFIEELNKYAGRPYDSRYEMGDDAIYCSELVYKAYMKTAGKELGKLVKLGDLDWQPFLEVIKKCEGGSPPLQREMITPKHLSEALQLEKVYAFGL